MSKVKNPVVDQLIFINCLQCRKPITRGYYGTHEGGGTCCKICEDIYDKREKYPGHTEEEFFNRKRSK